MNKFNLSYSPMTRRKKGVMTTFGVMVAPFYRIGEVAVEGAPVVIDAENPGFVKIAVAGECPNGVLGILSQEVYDPSVLGELANYEFHNNTKARVGDTVGIITGQGYIQTNNFDGEIAVGLWFSLLLMGNFQLHRKVQTPLLELLTLSVMMGMRLFELTSTGSLTNQTHQHQNKED